MVMVMKERKSGPLRLLHVDRHALTFGFLEWVSLFFWYCTQRNNSSCSTCKYNEKRSLFHRFQAKICRTLGPAERSRPWRDPNSLSLAYKWYIFHYFYKWSSMIYFFVYKRSVKLTPVTKETGSESTSLYTEDASPHDLHFFFQDDMNRLRCGTDNMRRRNRCICKKNSRVGYVLSHQYPEWKKSVQRITPKHGRAATGSSRVPSHTRTFKFKCPVNSELKL